MAVLTRLHLLYGFQAIKDTMNPLNWENWIYVPTLHMHKTKGPVMIYYFLDNLQLLALNLSFKGKKRYENSHR